ncbi:MAG: rhodanese-like domain-containing protein [Ardenticatenaceae bacterium]|nr:rhodanese-like domain-containing protein [Ardenticatenaceae bacterium]MCB8949363.1 rhodanese-like domain-containing protein [Ardenticatenaceae bacterium]
MLGTAVACGGTTATTTSAEPNVSADLSEVLDLADTIDVATVASVKDRDDVVVLDVREQWEYDEGHIPGVTLIPMGEVANRLSEIPTDKSVIVTCRSGNRSGQITDFLRQQGFDNVHNMDGGILAWEAAGYEVEQ